MTDASYNVTGLVDSSGHLKERYEYTPYGERKVYVNSGSGDARCTSPVLEPPRLVSADSITEGYGLCDFGFQGLMYEEELGIYYNRARYVHLLFGMMMRDPLGYVDGINGYENRKSNPVNGLDPTGLLLFTETVELSDLPLFLNQNQTRYSDGFLRHSAESVYDATYGTLQGIGDIGQFCWRLVRYGANKDLNPAIARTTGRLWQGTQEGYKAHGVPGAYAGFIGTGLIGGLDVVFRPMDRVMETGGSRESFRGLWRAYGPAIVSYGAGEYVSIANSEVAVINRIPQIGELPNSGLRTVIVYSSGQPQGLILRAPDGKIYSVAFQTELSGTSYPGVSRVLHVQEANYALLQTVEGDAAFAQAMRSGGINLQRTATGLAPRTPPAGWTWHHAQQPGIMQLVPRPQHIRGSIWWDIMHPGGQGGFAIWGK